MNVRTIHVLFLLVGVALGAVMFRLMSVQRSDAATETGAVPAVLRAHAIELVDENGKVRANLKVEKDGEAVFRMRDATGTIRVKLGASGDGSGLVLLDDRTEPGVHMLVKRDGTTLTLAERGKEKRVLKP